MQVLVAARFVLLRDKEALQVVRVELTDALELKKKDIRYAISVT